MPDIRDHIQQREAHLAEIETRKQAVRTIDADLPNCTFNGQPLPDGVYSTDPDPAPVWIKQNGKVALVRPRSLAVNTPYTS